jgi:putative transposase
MKYRKKVLLCPVAERVRELVREISKANEMEILKGHVSRDHVHVSVSAPPHLSASKLVQLMKVKTSVKLQQEFKKIQKEFWGRHVWARGYFVASSGNVTDEVIMQYIENQDVEKQDEDFSISE